MVCTAATLSQDTSSIFQPRCFLWNRFTDKRIQKCWCSTEDCVFISGSASLPHTAVHYLSVGQGKLSWGPIVCLREFWLCVFGTSTVHTGGVGGETEDGDPGPRGKPRHQGGVWLLTEALLGLLEGATHADSRTGRWGQSRRGARLALALSLTGSGQCPAAKGRGPAYAHKLISSESAGPPAQSGCLHCGPRALSCWGGEDGGRIEGGRENGGGDKEGETEREREEVEAGWVGRGLDVKLPLQGPAKSLSYMENTSCLQGNRTTSEFLQTKIALMSSDDLSVLWSGRRSQRVCHVQIPTRGRSSCSAERLYLQRTRRNNIMKKFNNCVETSVFIIPPLALDGDDLLVTNCVDLSRGPFGEPFHHLNSAGSNSHDLMRCRMPEICRLCFLFSPPTLFSSPAALVHNRKTRLTERSGAVRSGSGSAHEFALLTSARSETHLMSFPAGKVRVSLFDLKFQSSDANACMRRASDTNGLPLHRKTVQCERSKVI